MRLTTGPRACPIPLQQHIGAPAQPVVKVGDRVAVGDLVARIPEGKLGANLHASIAGQVVEVGDSILGHCGLNGVGPR